MPGFSSSSTSACGGAILPSVQNVVRTEQIAITMTSAPTVRANEPYQIARRVALLLGPRDCSVFVTIGGSTIFVGLGGAPPPFFVIDSFTNGGDPTFPFFFSSRRRHTRWNCDWSSDVCSSD